MSDVLVTFERGAVASLEIGDVLYTGQIFTLFAWLAEFVSKRRRGLSLRERLPGDAANPIDTHQDENPDGSLRGGAPGSATRATLLRQSSGFHNRGPASGSGSGLSLIHI